MQAGRARAREFRLLAGYMHWHEGSLGAEVARGDWWLVAASREYLLSLVRGECHCVRAQISVLHLAGCLVSIRNAFRILDVGQIQCTVWRLLEGL